MKTVRVIVPASSANLGPGFDSLALALGLHNAIALTEAEQGLSFHFTGEGADELARDPSNMVVRAAQAVFREVGRAPSGIRVRIHSDVPLSSGLGSSATALLGGIVAANGLLGYPLKRDKLLELAIKLEGHPDNVTAAYFGGLVISSYDGEELVFKTVSIESLNVVVVLPEIKYATDEARGALPEDIPLKDAAQNVGRTALVVQALVEGDYDLLGRAMRDRLHEPYRRKFVSGFEEASDAAREHGAAAVALSGAGPALIAFAEEGHEAVARAMAGAFQNATGNPARSWILPVDTQGIAISEMEVETAEEALRQDAVRAAGTPVAAPAGAKEAGAQDKPHQLGLGEAVDLLREQSGTDNLEDSGQQQERGGADSGAVARS